MTTITTAIKREKPRVNMSRIQARAALRALIMEGLNSGPGVVADASFFAD